MENEGESTKASDAFASFSKSHVELCTKCNTQMAIVVLSPNGNKPFGFGDSSSVDDVVHCYCLEQMTTNTPSMITTVGGSITNEHKKQTKTIEGFKNSLKQIEKRREENKVVDDIKKWIEREFEACDETVEELGVFEV